VGDRSAEAQRRIDKMRSIYDSTLRDVCIIQLRTEGAGGYGYGHPTYTNGATVACLFLPVKALESPGAQAQGIDGEIRLPRTVTITNLHRIKVTTLYGLALATPEVFEIVSGPIRTHIGQTMEVKLVTDGSET
jgi:hypothetical protein